MRTSVMCLVTKLVDWTSLRGLTPSLKGFEAA
jgi:hypothetical protein